MFLKQAKDELILTTALYILYCLLHYFSDLRRIRTGFVGKVGLPALKGLLDDLWQHKVLSTEDKDTVLEDHTSRADRARCLIDMVMGKGERASLAMIDCMLERDQELYLTLGLILPPSPTDRVGEL